MLRRIHITVLGVAMNSSPDTAVFFRAAAPRGTSEKDAEGSDYLPGRPLQCGEQAHHQPGDPAQGTDPAAAQQEKDKNGALYLNIRGLYPKSNRTKLCYLKDLANMIMTSMIVITESWLTQDIHDSKLTIPG